MWVLMNDAFLSIVEDPANPDLLTVRARVPGDIARVFPAARPRRTPRRDYLYRASLPRAAVAEAMAAAVRRIVYDNFKDSVADAARHAAYSRVWATLRALQPARQRCGTAPGGARRHAGCRD